MCRICSIHRSNVEINSCGRVYDTYNLITSLIAFNKRAREVLFHCRIGLLALNLLSIGPDEPPRVHA